MKKISVLVPCRNEENYIDNFLNSVISNDYPKEFLEVFFIDGLSNDGTRNIIQGYERKYSFVHLLINEKKIVPHALNIGIKKSTGDYIFILGAHSNIPENYFSTLIKWSEKLNADNIGCICKTEAKNKTVKSNSIIKVLSNKLGVGNSLFRIGTNEIKEVDNISFGCYKKEVYDRIGLYDERLERNQDIELNKRLTKYGGKIYLIPDLFFTYYARETFRGIAKNNFQTGLWNILTMYFTKRFNSISLRHLVPLIFLTTLILTFIATLWIPLSGLVTLSILIIYLLTIAIASANIKDHDSSLSLIFISFIILHFSYGVGSLIGLFKINKLFKGKK